MVQIGIFKHDTEIAMVEIGIFKHDTERLL